MIAYNADVSPGTKNNRMAYIGQNNLTAGAAVGEAILNAGVKSGDLVAGIIATPGTGNIQPRIDGAKPVLTKAGVKFEEVGTSATEGAPEYNKISAWYAGHQDVKWMMAVDSGDSNAVAQFIQKQGLKGKVGASVWDVGLPVVQAIKAGYVTATIDQQAYLQGFDTIMQLFLWNVSGGLMKPTNTDTGLGIVTKDNVDAVPDAKQVRGNVQDKEGIADAVLDLDCRERASGRFNVDCCPGGQTAGAAARSRVGGASGPARVPLPARADPDRHHDRAVRVLRVQGRVELHRLAQPELGRRLCGTGRRDRDRRGAAARAGRDRPVRRPGLPVLPVDHVLDAQRRAAAGARDRDRAPHRLPSWARSTG